MALGAVGESTLAHLFEPLLARVIPAAAAPWIAHSIAVAIALAIITYLHLVLGEYAPKAFAIEKADLRLAREWFAKAEAAATASRDEDTDKWIAEVRARLSKAETDEP